MALVLQALGQSQGTADKPASAHLHAAGHLVTAGAPQTMGQGRGGTAVVLYLMMGMSLQGTATMTMMMVGVMPTVMALTMGGQVIFVGVGGGGVGVLGVVAGHQDGASMIMVVIMTTLQTRSWVGDPQVLAEGVGVVVAGGMDHLLTITRHTGCCQGTWHGLVVQ